MNESSWLQENTKRLIYIFVLPVALVYLVWLGWMTTQNGWHLFLSDWYMTVTMVFGSFIAGGRRGCGLWQRKSLSKRRTCGL